MSEEKKPILAGRAHMSTPAKSAGPLPRRFPQMEKIFDGGELSSVLGKIEKTCRRLDEHKRSANAQDRQRAQAALTAYGHALQLLRELGQAAAATTAATREAGSR